MKRILPALMLILLVLLFATAQAECHHTYDMVDVKKATCESDGYYLLKCNDCGHTVKEITDKAYGHAWKLTGSREASCAEAGYKKYACDNCGKTKTDTIPALEHKWVDDHVLEEATCTKNGSKRVYCSVCHLTSTKTISKSHKYGEWTITEEATDHAKGTRTRTCKRCGKKQTESFYPEGTLYKNIKNKKTEVKELQQLLTDLDFLNDKVDGIFGAKTEKAVKAFQKEYGLNADGIAWPQTLQTLNETIYGGIMADGRGEAECCAMTLLEDGTVSWELCDTHLSYEMQATAGLAADASEAERLNCMIIAWQAELDVLYQTWLELCAPQEQPMVINHKTMFMGYLNSQKTLWSSQFGADSLQTLEMIRNLLMEQCCTLCPIVDGLQNAE